MGKYIGNFYKAVLFVAPQKQSVATKGSWQQSERWFCYVMDFVPQPSYYYRLQPGL